MSYKRRGSRKGERGEAEAEEPDKYNSSMSVNNEEEGDEFIHICAPSGEEEDIELPKEGDGTVLLSTIQGQFPDAVGLRYRSAGSGSWRGVRIVEGALKPPQGGWGYATYYVTMKKNSGVSKANGSVSKKTAAKTPKKRERERERDQQRDEYYLQDLFVTPLHTEVDDNEVREYFTNCCGEMAHAEVKKDHFTRVSRGFAFIRFKTAEGGKAALERKHKIRGEEVVVKISRTQDLGCQLFIGHVAKSVTGDDLKEYFSQYGEVTETYVAKPNRGFGFITFSSTPTAKKVIRMRHELKGHEMRVMMAENREDHDARRNMKHGADRRERRESKRYDPRAYNGNNNTNNHNNHHNHNNHRDRPPSYHQESRYNTTTHHDDQRYDDQRYKDHRYDEQRYDDYDYDQRDARHDLNGMKHHHSASKQGNDIQHKFRGHASARRPPSPPPLPPLPPNMQRGGGGKQIDVMNELKNLLCDVVEQQKRRAR